MSKVLSECALVDMGIVMLRALKPQALRGMAKPFSWSVAQREKAKTSLV